MKVKLSIIIVNYRLKKELFNCLEAIHSSDTKCSYEIIVIDNSKDVIDKSIIKKKYSWIRYYHNPQNSGFSAANNQGARYAQGKYLFFLNPDTKIYKNAIDILIHYLEKHENTAIAAPLILDRKKIPYPLQGTSELTPLKGIFALSFINKLFPKNPISKSYWLYWDKRKVKEVDIIPGTAFVIRKKIFDQVNGFDEHFFLYFEEADLCRRVRKYGYKIFILPESKIYHTWGASTKYTEDIDKIFSKSRFYYFKKHFGYTSATIVQLITSINKVNVLLIIIMLIALFFRLYKINRLMIFMADQGWFYLSARDIYTKGIIPLVGIPSSVVWLHQGPLATYLIYLSFLIGKFNPLAPEVLFSFLDILTIFLIFVIGKKFFNKWVGLFASGIYAVSPRVIVNIRMPYHTSPIPFFTCLFFLILYEIIHKNRYSWLLLLGFVLGLLMQMELSNGVIFFILIYLFYVYKIPLKRYQIIKFFAGFFIGIFPFFVYDIQHKFIQILGFPLWVINRIRLFFGLTWSGNSTTAHVPGAISTNWVEITRIIFPASPFIVAIILLMVMFFIFKDRRYLFRKEVKYGYIICLLWFVIPVIGYTVHAAPGSAYFPLLYPILALFMGFIFYKISQKYRFAFILFILFLLVNMYHIWSNNFYMMSKNFNLKCIEGSFCLSEDLDIRRDIAEYIVKDSHGKSFNVKGGGFISTFATGIDNYKYLIWWKGGTNMKNDAKLVYVIYENRLEIPKNEKTAFYNGYYSVVKYED